MPQYGDFSSNSFPRLTLSFLHFSILKELHLEKNDIGVVRATALSLVLASLPNLETLSLSRNCIKDLGLQALPRPLVSLLKLK
jgi:Leucine-rich repeat (LRR) protein